MEAEIRRGWKEVPGSLRMKWKNQHFGLRQDHKFHLFFFHPWMALTARSDLRRCLILVLEKHVVIETLHDFGRTYSNSWSFGRSPPLNGVKEEGADDVEGEEEVGRQGGGREESVVGLPVKPLVGY